MDFTFTFAAKTPVEIVNSTFTLLSGINGLSVSKLSLPPKASSALLVQLDKQVIRSTHDFVTERNVCSASHVTSSAAPDHVSSGASAATAYGGRAGGSTQISRIATATEKNAVPGVTPAESVLLGLSFLEAIQANKQLHYLLQQHGYIEAPSSSSSSGGSQAKPTTHAAGSDAVQSAIVQQQQVDFLIPMLTQCGVLESVTPVHDAAAVTLLKQRTWRSVFAPADEFRAYFGNHIGFYLAFLNSMTLWLLAPAAVSTFLTWALRSSGSSGVVGHTAHGDVLSAAAPAVIHSRLVPFLLIFHLLWSAAGLKLWKRQEAGLNHKWYSSSSSTGGIRHFVAGARRQFEQPRQQQQPTGCASYNSVQGSQRVTTTAAAAAPAGPAAAAAVGGSEIGRLPGSDVSAARWGEGVPAASLITPAAAGVRREYTGNWLLNPATNEAELLNPTHNQLLRLFTSIAATLLLLLAAAAVLLLCLNVQGYIPPHHRSVFVADLASLSLPGHVFGRDSGMLLSQVPMVLRVVAVTLFSSKVFGPAAKLLTAFENHRTVEGYAASLTAKQASLNALFTFAPVAYVGLLGAGAAAARAEVAGFFRIELIRRIVMEFLMPWIAYWLSLTKVRRQSNTVKHVTFDKNNNQSNPVKDAAGAVGALVEELTPRAAAAAAAHYDSSSRVVVQPAVMLKPDTKVAVRVSHGSASHTAASSSVTSECLKPSYDIFADCWETNRDLGYMILFAALYPPAAVICLLYNLVKIKQDCLKLLVVYRRPVPAQLRGIGSWKAVLAVQVFAAVITNVFLSGLSTGQLALLLPTPLVPESIKTALVAAAATRPGSSTAANQMHDLKLANAATAGPMLNILQDMSALGGRADVTNAASAAAMAQCTSVNSTIWQAAKMCPNNASDALFDETLSTGWCSPTMHNLAAAAAPGHALSSAGTAAAAADHLLLLFLLEHALVIVMLLILWAIPSQPGVVRAAARQQQMKTMQLLQQQQQQQEWGGVGTADDAKTAYKVA